MTQFAISLFLPDYANSFDYFFASYEKKKFFYIVKYIFFYLGNLINIDNSKRVAHDPLVVAYDMMQWAQIL